MPVSTNDSTTITKNFYIDYIDTTALAGSAFKNIYFDTDKYKLRPESITELNNISQVLTANAGLNISVEGHCDSRNTDEYNMVLGQNRADAAKTYLVKQGIADSRLTTVSYGERRPAAPNDSPENMQLNRRDEFKAVRTEGSTGTGTTGATGTGTMGTGTSTTTTTTTIVAPLTPGKSKVKMADGTKVKTKVDENSDKVKVKIKGADGSETKTKSANGEIDGKAKDANGDKTKVKVKN